MAKRYVTLISRDLALDDRVIGFRTDDPTYAEFHIATFEAAWNEAADAKKWAEWLEQYFSQA